MYRREHPVAEQPLNMSDRARLRELERENRDLRMQAEFLKKAAAFFRKSRSQRRPAASLTVAQGFRQLPSAVLLAANGVRTLPPEEPHQ